MGAQKKTSKHRVRAAVRKKLAVDAVRAEQTADVPDVDGFTKRDWDALNMRGLERLPYAEIGKKLGVGAARARGIVKEALERLDTITQETSEEIRRHELVTLDSVQSRGLALLEVVLAGDHKSLGAKAAAFSSIVTSLQKLMVRRDRLLGLSASKDNEPPPPPGENDGVQWAPELPTVDVEAPPALSPPASAPIDLNAALEQASKNEGEGEGEGEGEDDEGERE